MLPSSTGEVECGTIDSAELITKSCWRELLSDEFTLGNIDQLRYMKLWRPRKKGFIYISNILLKQIKLPDTSQGHYGSADREQIRWMNQLLGTIDILRFHLQNTK